MYTSGQKSHVRNKVIRISKVCSSGRNSRKFSLVDIKEEAKNESIILHIYPEEENKKPDDYQEIELYSNGFYPESMIKDFPLRDKKIILHVCRF
jgi:hypothetical protein